MHTGLALLALLSASPPAPTPAPAAAEQRLVVSTGLRVRAAPSPEAALVEKVPIGTVLPCTERSAPARVGAQAGAFCRATSGWYFEPLTAKVEADLDAQVQRLVDEKTKTLSATDPSTRPDGYEIHRFLLRRIDEAKTREQRMQAKHDELRYVMLHAEAFAKDPRVYRDESQGHRVKREVIWELADVAKGTPVAERVGWLAVEHGHDFECEGYKPCYVAWLKEVECAYLQRFPDGAHAAEALKRIDETVQDAIEKPEEHAEMTLEDFASLASTLAEVRQCVEQAKGGGAVGKRVAAAREQALARAKGVEPTR